MQHTHGLSQPHNQTNSTETRKGLGTIPSNERFHVADSTIPWTMVQLRFVNPSPGSAQKSHVRLANALKNVTAVYLEKVFGLIESGEAAEGTINLFLAGIKFTRATNYFTPNIIHCNASLPDYVIWEKNEFEENPGRFIIKDTDARLIRSYRSANYISDFEIQIIDAEGAPIPWEELNLTLRFETLDWQY